MTATTITDYRHAPAPVHDCECESHPDGAEQHHERRHERDGEPIEVTVWDLMAHRGRPREWAPDGRIVAYRGGI